MYYGLRFSSILITVMCLQLLYVLHVHLLRLALQLMSCICLVIKVSSRAVTIWQIGILHIACKLLTIAVLQSGP